jgi:hypothetical protein
MDTGKHTLPALFAQLGLASDSAAVARFTATHVLPPGMPLTEAGFWTPSQADFLREALADDAEWSEAADELANLLGSP